MFILDVRLRGSWCFAVRSLRSNLLRYLLYSHWDVRMGTNIELVFSFRKQSKPIIYFFASFSSYLSLSSYLPPLTTKKSTVKYPKSLNFPHKYRYKALTACSLSTTSTPTSEGHSTAAAIPLYPMYRRE